MSPDAFSQCPYCLARHNCAFSDLPDGVRRGFQAIAGTKFYARHQHVVREGDAAHGLFIVKSGVVRLYCLTPSGKATILNLLGPAGIVGLTEVMTGERYAVSAETVEDSQLEYLHRQEFMAFLHAHPQVTVTLLIWLSREVRQFWQRFHDTASKASLTARLWQNLRDLAESCGLPTAEGIKLSPHLTVPDLAHGLGCSRQWTSKLLGELEGGGRIKRRGRQVFLPLTAARGEVPRPESRQLVDSNLRRTPLP